MEWLYTTWYGILTIVAVTIILLLILSIVFYKQFFKRFYDFLLSLIALILLSPLLIILTIIGAIAMKGNPFFTQLRPGKNEKIFKLIKFRTMTNAKDKDGNLLPDAQRLTKYGKILRATSLDELPELFNILIGNMSIVGPRPLLVSYLPYYTMEEKTRHNIRPGLTGLAQVKGRNSVKWDERLSYDVKYVRSYCFLGDFAIIIKTVFSVFSKSGLEVNTEDEGNLAEIRNQRME